jgi:opacity protein-like surface antigen
MIGKLTLALLLTLPTIAVAIDLEGYYITAKGGVSKTSDTGTASYGQVGIIYPSLKNDDLGTGSAFGFSVGKYLTDSFRLELEAIKRTSYELDTYVLQSPTDVDTANIDTTSLFINSFYDFQPLTISNTSITPYVGGGIGISRNKMGITTQLTNGVPVSFIEGHTTSEFAYKFSAGTLLTLTEQLSLDVNYQYVNLGEFESSTAITGGNLQRPISGGEIKTQELMVGLQYTFK